MLQNNSRDRKIEQKSSSISKSLWPERALAILALMNFGLVLFDLSYIPWRNLYFHYLNPVTKIYDPLKGIEPHRETAKYLATVDSLKQQVQTQGWQSITVQATLNDLGEQSARMIETNPFQLAGKTGALEKMKNHLRDHMKNESARGSFKAFWNSNYLTTAGAERELAYFDRQIRPLIAINYFRESGEDGDFVDRFWLIDLGFVGIFGLELLWHVLTLKRRFPRKTWREVILTRWYDLFLLQPWLRWLRIIPVTIRFHKAKIIDLSAFQGQINSLFVNELADEITQVVVTQVLSQAQGSIKNGTASKLITERLLRPYVDLNDVNELEAIAQILLEIAIYRILPKIQPDLEEIINHLLQSALVGSPALQSLKVIPGFAEAPNQVIDQLVRQVSDALYLGLTKALHDPENTKLSRRLTENLTAALGNELQKSHTIAKIESLLTDMLEEMKVSYVHNDLANP